MQVIEKGTFGKVFLYWSHLYFYINVILLFLQQSRNAVDQAKWKTNDAELNQNTQDKRRVRLIATLKEKHSFKLGRREEKQELRTVSNRRQKAAPRQVLAE